MGPWQVLLRLYHLLSVGKLDDARLQLINACQEEPMNEELAERLQIVWEALALEPL